MSSRDEYVAKIKAAAISVGKYGVMEALVLKVPFLLKYGFLGNVASAVVGLVLSFAVNKTEMGAFFLYVDMRVGEQRDSFMSDADANWKAQQSGTREEKKRAEENLVNSFRKFAKLTS